MLFDTNFVTGNKHSRGQYNVYFKIC